MQRAGDSWCGPQRNASMRPATSTWRRGKAGRACTGAVCSSASAWAARCSARTRPTQVHHTGRVGVSGAFPGGVPSLYTPPGRVTQPRAPDPTHVPEAEAKPLSPPAACLNSPCLNGGTCHLIAATGTTVCACPPGHAGRLCNIGESPGSAPRGLASSWLTGHCCPLLPNVPTVPAESCFLGNGTEYRGVASTSASGLSCLAWNSDLLYQELHVDSVGTAALLGLGPHAYCRSAPARPARGHRILGGQGLSWGLPPSDWEAAPARRARRGPWGHRQSSGCGARDPRWASPWPSPCFPLGEAV